MTAEQLEANSNVLVVLKRDVSQRIRDSNGKKRSIICWRTSSHNVRIQCGWCRYTTVDCFGSSAPGCIDVMPHRRFTDNGSGIAVQTIISQPDGPWQAAQALWCGYFGYRAF
jgi:hypothetical protein